MRLVEDVAQCRSVAIVGLAKNAGKTECLNYILRRLALRGHATALTSIGVDGETRDSCSALQNPRLPFTRTCSLPHPNCTTASGA